MYTDQNLIVCIADGKPKDPRNLLREYSRLISKAGLPKISFHDLPHTHATIMFEICVHPKVVAERLGHSRVGITLDLYSHVNQDIQDQAALQYENAVCEQNSE